jgi:hypothetical protein
MHGLGVGLEWAGHRLCMGSEWDGLNMPGLGSAWAVLGMCCWAEHWLCMGLTVHVLGWTCALLGNSWFGHW